MANITWPNIPNYIKDPIVFYDVNLGLCMVGTTGTGEQWLFRAHGDHWCSERRTGDNDPLFIAPLNTLTPAAGTAGDKDEIEAARNTNEKG